MSDDLNTPKALGVFHKWMKNEIKKIKSGLISKQELRQAFNFLINFDLIFGFIYKRVPKIPLKVRKLIEQRDIARESKNWKMADSIRNQVENMGWKIEDTDDGQKLKKA